MTLQVKIAGVGRCLPSRVVPSDEVAELCGIEPGWIETHAGVEERRWAAVDEGETNAWMGAQAGIEALQEAGLDASEIDCVIYASASVQQLIPDTSVYVLQELGLANAGIVSFSVHATCLSFVTALDVAACRIATGRSKRILIVSSEVTSMGLNFNDAESAALFGDGAAAVVLTETPQSEASCLHTIRFETYASGAELTKIEGLGSRRPPNDPRTQPEHNLFAMDGPEVLRFTLRRAPRFLSRLFEGTDLEDIKCIIPHQTSRAGLDALERFGMEEARVIRTLPLLGNCVAASIPMALYEAIQSERLNRGDLFLLLGTSAGLTLGGAILTF